MNLLNERQQKYLRAGNYKTAPTELRRLSHSQEVYLRSRVAENPNTPLGTLFELSADESFEVRVALTYNHSLPLMLQSALANDSNPDVRYAMAENFNLPCEILALLAEDENPYVVQRAKLSMAMASCMPKEQDTNTQEILAA